MLPLPVITWKPYAACSFYVIRSRQQKNERALTFFHFLLISETHFSAPAKKNTFRFHRKHRCRGHYLLIALQSNSFSDHVLFTKLFRRRSPDLLSTDCQRRTPFFCHFPRRWSEQTVANVRRHNCCVFSRDANVCAASQCYCFYCSV